MNPLVSIVIPVYNRVNLVEETICSAIKQTYKNIEIIIVDNCSTDGTWELLQEFAQKDERVHVFRNPENIGPVLNWEKGIALSTGSYIKILFSDDKISENFIEETINLFDDTTAFVISKIQLFGDESLHYDDPFSVKKIYQTKEYLEDKLLLNLKRFPVSPGAALFRKDDLKYSLNSMISNPLNLDFNMFGAGTDLLIYLNIAIRYQYVKIAPNAKSYFRHHQASFTVSNKLNVYYDYVKYYFIKNNIPDLLPKLKTIFWLRDKKGKSEILLNSIIEGKFNYFFAFQALVTKLFVKR